jgi:excisionase family DNA binding protein
MPAALSPARCEPDAPCDYDELTQWIGVAEAAALLGVHVNTIYRHINSGRLPFAHWRLGGRWRIARHEVEAVCEQ